MIRVMEDFGTAGTRHQGDRATWSCRRPPNRAHKVGQVQLDNLSESPGGENETHPLNNLKIFGQPT